MLRLLLICLALMLPQWAAASAVVEQLSHVDRSGRWRMVDQTDQGSVFRPSGEDLLRKGATVQAGDRLSTRAARVQLRLADGSVLNVGEDSELVVEEVDAEGTLRRVTQAAGEVWYQLRNALTVEHGTVETIVEGTRFLVRQGSSGSTVQVEEGQVRTADRALRARQQLVLDAANQGEVARWRPKATDFARTWPLGRPRWLVDVLLSPELQLRSDGEIPVGGGLRVVGSAHLPADLRLQLSGGLAGLSGPSVWVPVGVGLAWEAGAFSLGGELASALERCNSDCDDPLLLLHLGGAGSVRTTHTLTRRLRLVGELRGGYLAGAFVQPGVGLQWGL